MNKGRLEAFTTSARDPDYDHGLELKVPHGLDLERCVPLVPVFLSYVLSFVYLGIVLEQSSSYLHAAERINGKILWANLHSCLVILVPFVTGWLGENDAAPPRRPFTRSAAVRGIAYFILKDRDCLRSKVHIQSSRKQWGNDLKGNDIADALRCGDSDGLHQ